MAGIAAVDLVEDDACGAGRQPRIALNPAAELGLHVAARVVEDDTLLANVELLVGIARHPARTGRGDVHLGRAIGRSDHGRALVGRCARVGGNPARVSWRLLCGQRLHQSHPAQHQPQREADRLQGTDRPAAAVIDAPLGSADQFGRNLHDTQRAVEDQTIDFVHGADSFRCCWVVRAAGCAVLHRAGRAGCSAYRGCAGVRTRRPGSFRTWCRRSGNRAAWTTGCRQRHPS